MAQIFHLRLLLAGHDDLICKVKEADQVRLKSVIDTMARPRSFFWVDALNGRSFVVNLEHVQGVRFLWDVAPREVEPAELADEGMQIALVGKEMWSEYPSEDPREVFNLFWELELGGSDTVTFNDADGEDFTLFTRQIVYLSALTEMLDKGRGEVEEEDEAG